MIYCLNPNCRDRLNPEDYKFCQSCGSQLLLRNRYSAIKCMGGGGFGRTYLAIDQDCMNMRCVVKQFSPSPDIQAEPVALRKATEMFYQEAVRLLQLGEHPQIPRLLAYFEQEKHLYLVQELIAGQDLRQELARQGAFNEQKIRQLLADLLPVLKFIHTHGVIHRDIKPGNIMRRRTPPHSPPYQGGDRGGLPYHGGDRGSLVLIDFGVSKLATGKHLGTVGTKVGTAGFTPLEQMRGQAIPASDLYSLGVTCVCLLTRSLPKEDGSDEAYDPMECRWKWRERLPKGITISQELGQILDKLLQDLPKNRYQSADEVMQDLYAASSSNLSEKENGVEKGKGKGVGTVQATHNAHSDRSGETLNSNGSVKHSQTANLANEAIGITPPPDRLISAVGIDYSQLRQLLAAKKWKEADLATTAILLKVSGREQEGWMRAEDFKKFPCQDLWTIDQLWVYYSRGRFGFSVQKSIWESIGGKRDIDYLTWCRFGDRIGWRVNGNWLHYSQLTFNPDGAPLGHLPAGGLDDVVLGKWDLVCCSLSLRLKECNL